MTTGDMAAFESQMQQRGDLLLRTLQAETLHQQGIAGDDATVLDNDAMRERRRAVLQELSAIYAEIVTQMMGTIGQQQRGKGKR